MSRRGRPSTRTSLEVGSALFSSIGLNYDRQLKNASSHPLLVKRESGAGGLVVGMSDDAVMEDHAPGGHHR